MNTARAERLATETQTCPRERGGCGAAPHKRCWRPAEGNPTRRTLEARPHEVRVELIRPADWSV